MLAGTKSRILAGTGNRKASEPYTIYLGNDHYILTQEVLAKNVEGKLLRSRRWYYPKLKFLSFSMGKLELSCTHQASSETLTILVENDKLHVSCSCNGEVSMLCFHAYKALDRLLWGGETEYFQQFKPNGLYQIAHSHKKFFAIKPTDKGISISRKPGLGLVYALENTLDSKLLAGALNVPGNDEVKPVPFPNNTALTYVIVQSSQDRFLPFLVPCTGRLTKEGNFMKGFIGFVNEDQKGYDKYLSEDQRLLNKLCFNTRRMIEHIPGTLLNAENSPEQWKNIQAVYDFWKSVFPILRFQPFLHLYYLYWMKELKKRPSKSRIQPVRVSTDEPELRFRLVNKRETYQFDLRVYVKNKEVKDYLDSASFFIHDYDHETIYLLSSLRDAAILEWVKLIKNKITVFKEHFQEFESEVLNPLQHYYPIDTF